MRDLSRMLVFACLQSAIHGITFRDLFIANLSQGATRCSQSVESFACERETRAGFRRLRSETEASRDWSVAFDRTPPRRAQRWP